MIACILHYIVSFKWLCKLTFLIAFFLLSPFLHQTTWVIWLFSSVVHHMLLSPFAMQVIVATDVWVQSAGLSVQEV
jgi:hypothetical protein